MRSPPGLAPSGDAAAHCQQLPAAHGTTLSAVITAHVAALQGLLQGVHAQKVAEGRALFNESLDMTGEKELHYPEIKKKPGYEDSMFPDVFIYLMRDGKHIAYIRHKGYDLFEASKKKISKKDFVPRWCAAARHAEHATARVPRAPRSRRGAVS